jgi:predicted nucleic acid-binding protein
MSANDRSFIDTNVWLYALVAGDHAKSAAAASLLQRSSIAISGQVINEVCVNLIRKANFGEPDVRTLIESFYGKCLVVGLDKSVLLRASELRDRYSLSFWDSTIIASALHCQATILYSEDLQHGLLIDGVLRIVNPFFAS